MLNCMNWSRRCGCFTARWTWTHLNSAIKVHWGQTGPPGASRRPRKPIQPPNDVTVNTGTSHRGSSYLHCTWINRRQLIVWVWTSGAAVDTPQPAHTPPTTVTRSTPPPTPFCSGRGLSWAMGVTVWHAHAFPAVFPAAPAPLPRRRFFSLLSFPDAVGCTVAAATASVDFMHANVHSPTRSVFFQK